MDEEQLIVEWEIRLFHYLIKSFRMHKIILTIMLLPFLIGLVLIGLLIIKIGEKFGKERIVPILAQAISSIPPEIGWLTIGWIIITILLVIFLHGIIIATRLTDRGIYQYIKTRNKWQEAYCNIVYRLTPGQSKELFTRWDDITSFKVVRKLSSFNIDYPSILTAKPRIQQVIALPENFERALEVFSYYLPNRQR